MPTRMLVLHDLDLRFRFGLVFGLGLPDVLVGAART
jgi:hypothetical protein